MINNLINEQPDSRMFQGCRDAKIKFNGLFDRSADFVAKNQFYDVGVWRKFVEIFRRQTDGENRKWLSWRSEFWGKMMRGASLVEAYSNDDGVYRILEATVRDLLSVQEESGRISGYAPEIEFTSWDMWGRKYVMLGLQYFLDICRDHELANEIVKSLTRHADYIIEHIGEGKLDICDSSKHWEGLNSCSILEPMVRLYRLTGEKRYLDFSEYIISTGFIKSANLVELAFEDKTPPYRYPVVKAYEMMSCFEGLLQYACVTGNQKYRTAVLNYGYRILNEEQSIIGCSGCTNELFDHTVVKQTQTGYPDIVQETCVAVTWMKLAVALLELSGDVRFADSIERTFYNCYLGALNTHRNPVSSYPKEDDLPQILPFDSYSPLTADVRGRRVGGYGAFPDKTFYGCCASIGGAGAGMMPVFAVMKSNDGIVLNLYERGTICTETPTGKPLTLSVDTVYPLDGRVKTVLSSEETERFSITLRIPEWCRNATVAVNGKPETAVCGYLTLTREWQNGDEILLDLPMHTQRLLPPEDAVNAGLFAGYRRGPIVLAADARICNPRSIIDLDCDADGYADGKQVDCPEIPDCLECYEFATGTGERVRLIDYSSAGKTYKKDSECAAWLRKI